MREGRGIKLWSVPPSAAFGSGCCWFDEIDLKDGRENKKAGIARFKKEKGNARNYSTNVLDLFWCRFWIWRPISLMYSELFFQKIKIFKDNFKTAGNIVSFHLDSPCDRAMRGGGRGSRRCRRALLRQIWIILHKEAELYSTAVIIRAASDCYHDTQPRLMGSLP